jgi:hypothetical protein
MKKKMNKELSARIKADSSKNGEAALSVRRHNTKPNVTCSQSPAEILEKIGKHFELFKKELDNYPNAFSVKSMPNVGYVLECDLDELEEKPVDEEYEKIKSRLMSIVDDFNKKIVSAAKESPVKIKIRSMDMASPFFDIKKPNTPIQVRIFSGNEAGAGYEFGGLT